MLLDRRAHSLRFFFLLCVLLEPTACANVTFTPQAIRLTINDLPAPYATVSASKSAHVVGVPSDPSLYAPEGFTVKLYMDGLSNPRLLIYTPAGDLLVSEPSANRISCLVDNNADGFPDERRTVADASNGLNSPFGMAFSGGYLYVGNADSTRRYPWTSTTRTLNGTGEIIVTYDSTGHTTRTVLPSLAGDRLFVSVGSASNVDIEPLPRASIQHKPLTGGNQTTWASGLRNVVGLAYHPISGDLYASCQERDALGDDLVPDFFTRIQQNGFYGWPYAYLSPNLTDPRRRLANGSSERPDLVSLTQTPDVLFQAHSAVLDMRFYTGNQFPPRYQNGAFAAFHGSWNRNNGTGYKVVFIPFNSTTNRPLGYYEDFVTGFLLSPSGPDTFGRPVGLLVLNDGSLLFTEDGNNRIYQVQYNQRLNNRTVSSGGTNDTTSSTASSTPMTMPISPSASASHLSFSMILSISFFALLI